MIHTEHIDQINRTAAVPLLVRAQHELLEAGFADPVVLIYFDDEAVIARFDNQLAGVMSFSYAKWERSLFIRLGYVKPEFRRRGIYRAMFEHLIRIAQEKKAVSIQGMHHVNNETMLKTAAALNRQLLSATTTFSVPQK